MLNQNSITKIKFSYEFYSLYGGMHDAELMSHT